MKTKEEIIKKTNEALEMIDAYDFDIEEYMECVIDSLRWVIDEGDDPLEDYYLDGF